MTHKKNKKLGILTHEKTISRLRVFLNITHIAIMILNLLKENI